MNEDQVFNVVQKISNYYQSIQLFLKIHIIKQHTVRSSNKLVEVS